MVYRTIHTFTHPPVAIKICSTDKQQEKSNQNKWQNKKSADEAPKRSTFNCFLDFGKIKSFLQNFETR